MICTSIFESDKSRLMERLEGLEFAEVRLDALSADAEELREIFSRPAKLIATMRPGRHTDEQRLMTLAAAVGAGASYVDVEIDAPTIVREGVMAAARKSGCEVIVSYHNYEKTPEREELLSLVEECFTAGADIAKIACRANSLKDAARILGILDIEKPIIAIGMGRMGRITRVAAPLLGSPFTFASQGEGSETAEGQIDTATLQEILSEIERADG
jgi:3-dehydroquinate dehydratase-1